ncbi:hypothetical protein JXI42_13425 [bacterium]|nr:hypothetical protein [bacterium]
MKIKTLIFWLVIIIVCIILYMQFFGEGVEEGMPIDTIGTVELKIVNATSSQSDFYIDGTAYRIFAEKQKIISNVPTGKHTYKCTYVDFQWQNTKVSGKLNVQSNLTITISPKLGVIW